MVLKQTLLAATKWSAQAASQGKDKEIKKSTRKDKRLFFEYQAAFSEEAVRKGVSKTVYRLTKEMFGKQSSRIALVKDKNGMILLDPDKIDEWWVVHFGKLFNRPRSSD